jgi:hypothetical protein
VYSTGSLLVHFLILFALSCRLPYRGLAVLLVWAAAFGFIAHWVDVGVVF